MRKQIYRSSITGKIVTEKFAKQNPDTTTKETLCDLRQELEDFFLYFRSCGENYERNTIEQLVDDYLNQK